MSSQTLEGTIKIRDGKKWKKRLCILENPSTATSGASRDLALLNIHKNVKFSRKPVQKKRVVRLENLYGLESGFLLDKECRTLAIICQAAVTILAFDSDPELYAWEAWLRNHFGHGCQYCVYVVDTPLALSTIKTLNGRIHLRDNRLCLVIDQPPRIAVELDFREIRRYGAMDNRFCLEAGSRSGPLAGSYVFRTGHPEQMMFTFRLAGQGELRRYLSSSDSKASRSAEASTPYTSSGSYSSISRKADNSGSLRNAIGSSSGGPSSFMWDDQKPLIRSTNSERPAQMLGKAAYLNEACNYVDSNYVTTGSNQNAPKCFAFEHAPPSSSASSVVRSEIAASSLNRSVEARSGGVTEKHSTDVKIVESCVSRPTTSKQIPDQRQKVNYENASFLASLGLYYSVPRLDTYERPVEPTRMEFHSEGVAVVASNYLEMAPKMSPYEQMELPIVEEFVGGASPKASTAGQRELSGGNLWKPFEPVIVRKQDYEAGPLRIDRKLSLPTYAISQPPEKESWHYRRFSLEERVTSSTAPAVQNGNGLSGLFRSTSTLARDVLRNGSVKAKTLFGSILRKTSTTKESPAALKSAEKEDWNEDGRQSRAYSEPPFGTLSELDGQLHGTAEMSGLQPSKSSLDLDEVELDVASITSAQHLPPDVLTRLGFKPLVPEHTEVASSSYQPVARSTKSFCTDSTRSSIISGLLAGDFQVDRNSLVDSVSVGSDNSDSDSVFQPRTAEKKHVNRAVIHAAKNDNKPSQDRSRLVPGTTVRKVTPILALEPHRLSVNAKRRFHENVTKPLSGSYSQYDGNCSSESQLMSPSVLGSSNLSTNKSTWPAMLGSANRGRLGAGASNRFLKSAAANRWPLPGVEPTTRLQSSSPSPPAEHAPSPPTGATSKFSTHPNLSQSVQPCADGHIFKFPGQDLNYALLAMQAEKSPTTPASAGASWQMPRSSSSTTREAHSVEYARIDQVATRAAREVFSSGRDGGNRRSASHAFLVGDESSQDAASVGTLKSWRRFSLKRPLIRRRISLASLTGT